MDFKRWYEFFCFEIQLDFVLLREGIEVRCYYVEMTEQKLDSFVGYYYVDFGIGTGIGGIELMINYKNLQFRLEINGGFLKEGGSNRWVGR